LSKKAIIYTIPLTILILLSSFELTLHLFHSPFNSIIIEQNAHQLTWNYLLKQRYISFIDLDIFTISEKRHLLDVKRVFDNIYSIWSTLLYIITPITLFLYLKSKRELFLALSYSVRVGVVVNIISIIVSINFLDSFKLLHKIIFTNNSWIFKPNSILIEWFPISYFIEFFSIFTLLNFLILGILHNLKNQ
jgi:integral membrane protein (TIGR01906 family)